MKFLAQPVDNQACGSYRMIWPAEALRAHGAEVEITTHGITCVWNKEWTGRHPPSDARIIALAGRPDCDVVIWQRPARRWLSDLIPMLHAVGVGVVVDIDDRLDKIEHGNFARDHFAPVRKFGSINVNTARNWTWLERACRLADIVTASTPELADHFGFGHGYVIPNYMPERYLKIEPAIKRQAVGWTGLLKTHPRDLQVVGDAINRVTGTGWPFHVLGSSEGISEALRLPPDRITHHPFVPLQEYPEKMAEIGIGIVPLYNSEFNRSGKSWLKTAEFASLGVPVVATPIPDNVRLNRYGVGLLANSSGQWRRKLQSLISSEQNRIELAERGREAMRRLTIEANLDRYLNTWARAKR